MIMKGFAGPFKVKIFKKHNKSFQHKICEKANGAVSTPEVIPLVTYKKRIQCF
jgi:hypothetical protein